VIPRHGLPSRRCRSISRNRCLIGWQGIRFSEALVLLP
jgi:hypothetical protein